MPEVKKRISVQSPRRMEHNCPVHLRDYPVLPGYAVYVLAMPFRELSSPTLGLSWGWFWGLSYHDFAGSRKKRPFALPCVSAGAMSWRAWLADRLQQCAVYGQLPLWEPPFEESGSVHGGIPDIRNSWPYLALPQRPKIDCHPLSPPHKVIRGTGLPALWVPGQEHGRRGRSCGVD